MILSVLLGSHPPILPVRTIVRTTELFGINEGTTRVALSRLVADHDVVAQDGRYRLSDRLLARQERLDEGRSPATRAWRGTWEMGVFGAGVQSAAARATVGAELASLRLGELRSGVWTRPANLRRAWPNSLQDLVWRFEVRPGPSAGLPPDGPAPGLSAPGRSAPGRSAPGRSAPDRSSTARSPTARSSSARSSPSRSPYSSGSTLADSLWDLKGWASQAEALLEAFAADETPARRFVTAAAMVRHLQADPLLPASLLPDGWPGRQLRRTYAGYEEELGELLRREQRRHA